MNSGDRTLVPPCTPDYGWRVMRTLFRPWQTARTWWAITHACLDIFVGTVTFTVMITLLSLTAGLLIVFPIAIPIIWLTFAAGEVLGRLERSRTRALLGVDIPNPHRPLERPTWWGRLMERVRSGSRWREIAYLVLLLPIAGVTFTLTVVMWCGSAALLALPIYVHALPDHVAKFGLFSVHAGGGAWPAAAIGVVGLALVAPWATVGIAAVETRIARALLGPPARDDLADRVTRLEASRVAAVESAEAERRRLERDLHDGAQQRLVGLAMDLGRANEQFDRDPEKARELVVGAHQEAKAALSDLRELVRGFAPAVLADRGLDAALSAVVARSPVPVELHVEVPERPPAPIESTAYFVVTEALTNVAKHARASRATVAIARRGDRLVVEVSDDGIGGADTTLGTGLRGLEERVRAVGGWMRVMSPAGGPTTLMAELPCGS